MSLHYEDAGLRLWHGSCKDILPTFADESFDSICTDPPYELGFMGKGWDSSGIAYDVDVWRECFRVLKPGGFLLAFGGSRTWHRIAVAIEDAGFEVRDSIAWLYGSGFPKSLDVAKAIDKAARGVPQGGEDPTSPNHGQYRTSKTEGQRWDGDNGQSYGAGGSRFLTNTASERTTAPSTQTTKETAAVAAGGSLNPTQVAIAREWEGWGTALKPAFEPIIVARKPLRGTVAANVLAYGTGALNIDATRTSAAPGDVASVHGTKRSGGIMGASSPRDEPSEPHEAGRWPTNVVLDESQAAALDEQTGVLTSGKLAAHHARNPKEAGILGAYGSAEGERGYGDSGGASRFFPTFRYEAKAPGTERPEVDGVQHATVKPLELMRWLVRLVTRPGGRVLDLFAGSGTTGEAALLEGMEVDLIELEADHLPLILARVRKPLQPSMFGDWDEAS